MQQHNHRSCPQLWRELATINTHQVALIDERLVYGLNITLTFVEMNPLVDQAAHVSQIATNLHEGQHVTILDENSARWSQVDHATYQRCFCRWWNL
jgi:long-subunit acyl-CoA synthetase (AMP-forming)